MDSKKLPDWNFSNSSPFPSNPMDHEKLPDWNFSNLSPFSGNPMDHLAFLTVKHTNEQEEFSYSMGHLTLLAINHTSGQEDFSYPMGHLTLLAINHTSEQEDSSYPMDTYAYRREHYPRAPLPGKSRFRDTPANPDFAISPQIPICTSTLSYFRPVFHQVPKEPAAITAISPQRPGSYRKKAQNAAKRSIIK